MVTTPHAEDIPHMHTQFSLRGDLRLSNSYVVTVKILHVLGGKTTEKSTELTHLHTHVRTYIHTLISNKPHTHTESKKCIDTQITRELQNDPIWGILAAILYIHTYIHTYVHTYVHT